MNPIKILVLNDDPTMCKQFHAWFHPPVYEILIPSTSMEALSHAADPHCQVALIDTGFNGIDLSVFLARLKAQNSRIQILVTASIHSDAIEKAARLGGILYYTAGPFNFKIIKKIVDCITVAYPATRAEKSLVALPAPCGDGRQ